VLATDFSVRWTGFFEAPASGQYTFQPAIPDNLDRVKLWFAPRSSILSAHLAIQS